MKGIILLSLLFSISAFSQALSEIDSAQIDLWEKSALSEIEKHKKQAPYKEFLLYLTIGREASAHGLKEKAKKYYQKAIDHSSASDKSEAYVEMINLSLTDKEELKLAIQNAQKWMEKNPRYKKKEIIDWINLIESYASTNTTIPEKSYFKKWATEAKIQELIEAKKYQQAYSLVGTLYFDETNINEKIRFDLLATLSLQKASPPLVCKTTLDRYPTSLTWTMRVCRYLSDWKEGKKSKQTIEAIRKQIELESPHRSSWADALESLP
jgi:tetratricopeptide (TPR) repeat protein